MCEIIISTIATVVGGLVLTLILFLLNEFIFPRRDFSGVWQSKSLIKKSSLKQFEGLTLFYQIVLIQNGNSISGTGEKIKEINKEGETIEYIRKKRVIIDIEGYYNRRFLRRSTLNFKIIEQGRERETRAIYNLTVKHPKELVGHFSSTAADSSGELELNKE